MVERRRCQQCGAQFAPRREHARFCSGECRVGWGREKLGDEVASLSALQWSAAAMADQAERLPDVAGADPEAAAAAIGELVWQVTIVDATLVRYYPDVYDAALAALPDGGRTVEGTMTGLRFVRNQMRGAGDPGGFLSSAAGGRDAAGSAVARDVALDSTQDVAQAAAWRWRPVPPPAVDGLLPRSREWELERYDAYLADLAGQTTGETLQRAAAFLGATLAAVTDLAEVSQPVG